MSSISQKNPTTFDKITAIAITLQQGKCWDADAGKKARSALSDDKIGLHNLDGIHKLLNDDLTAITDLFQNNLNEPSPQEEQNAEQLLRIAHFTLAADALKAINRGDEPGQRVKAWISIPLAKRVPIDAYMASRYPEGGINRRMMATAALEMYEHALPKDVPTPQAYLDQAIKFGIYPHGPITFESALNLAQVGNTDGAVQLARALAAAAPTDAQAQRAAVNFVLRYIGVDAGLAQFRTELKSLPEPSAREVRLGFVDRLAQDAYETNNKSAAGALDKMIAGDDSLLAGDALQVTKHFADASAKFHQALQVNTTPLTTRLDAWSGLLDNDPGAAVAAGSSLLDEIEKLSVDKRADILNWFGWQLWHACERDLAIPRGRQRMSWHTPHQSLDDAHGGVTALAPLMQRLVTLDPITILTPDARHTPNSLRVPAAMFFALHQQPEKAVEIIARRLDYQLPPPPGGWKIYDGSPDKNADKPRPAISPRDGAEGTAYLSTLLDCLTRSSLSPQVTPPLLDELARDLAIKLKDTTNAPAQVARIHSLAVVIAYSAIALNPLPEGLRLDQPPPTPHEVDMVRFHPIDDALRQALAQDTVAKQIPILLREGLTSAMEVASNPKLLDALYSLITYTLDRYKSTGVDAKHFAYEVSNVADRLDGREVYDLKPYANRLRQTYLHHTP